MNTDNSNITNSPEIDPDEFSAMETEAEKAKADQANSLYRFTHKFRKPFLYEKKEFTELTFDFDELTGQDAVDIEDELAALGINLVAPEFSTEYHMRMLAKACTEKIGYDAFLQMPLSSFSRIKRNARNFMLVAE